MLRFGDELSVLTPYVVPPVAPAIKLDANECAWALPSEARELLGRRIAEAALHRYPDGRASELRAVLAERLGCREDAIVLGVGSDEVIAILLAALSKPGRAGYRAALFPAPTFVMYRHSSLAHGHRPIEVPLGTRWALDLPAMHRAFEEHDPSVAFYATPNNPTGNAFDESALRELVSAYPRTLHIIDEAYGPFHRQTPDDVPHSLGDWAERHPNVAVMGTLSKVGLAGLRVGWLRAPIEVAGELEKVRQPFNLSTLSQVAAKAALTELGDVIERHARDTVRERLRLAAELTRLGLGASPSFANFVLTDVGRLGTGADVAAALRARDIGVRAFGDPALRAHVRITVGTASENTKLIDELTALAAR